MSYFLKDPFHLVLWVFLSVSPAFSSALKGEPTYLLPLNCSELLPDNTTFLSFFESVGRGQVISQKDLSQKVFRILALRDKLGQSSPADSGINPVDVVIRRTLCFYRQQKEALQPVPYYDPKFISFLKDNIRELEQKVEAVIIESQYKTFHQEMLEKRAKQNQALVEEAKRRADKSAAQTFERLTRSASQKAKVN